MKTPQEMLLHSPSEYLIETYMKVLEIDRERALERIKADYSADAMMAQETKQIQ